MSAPVLIAGFAAMYYFLYQKDKPKPQLPSSVVKPKIKKNLPAITNKQPEAPLPKNPPVASKEVKTFSLAPLPNAKPNTFKRVEPYSDAARGASTASIGPIHLNLPGINAPAAEVKKDVVKQINAKPVVAKKKPKTVAQHNNITDVNAASGASGVVGLGNASTVHLEPPTVVAPPVTPPPEQLPPPYRENGKPIPPEGHKVGTQTFHHFGHPNCPENTWCNRYAAGEKASADDPYGFKFGPPAESEGHAMANHHCVDDPMCTKYHKSTSTTCHEADARLPPRADGKSWKEVIPGCDKIPWYLNLPAVDLSMINDPWFISQIKEYPVGSPSPHIQEIMVNIASHGKRTSGKEFHEFGGKMTDKCYKKSFAGHESYMCISDEQWGKMVRNWNSFANIAKGKKGQPKTDYTSYYKELTWHP